MGLVIDTSAVIQLERKQLALPTALRNEPVILSAIVWAELLIGVRLANTPQAASKRRTQLEQLRASLPFIDVTVEIAECYADMQQFLVPDWVFRFRSRTIATVATRRIASR